MKDTQHVMVGTNELPLVVV